MQYGDRCCGWGKGQDGGNWERGAGVGVGTLFFFVGCLEEALSVR